jgi:hypothetical protein
MAATKLSGRAILDFSNAGQRWFDSIAASVGRHRIDLSGEVVVIKDIEERLAALNDPNTYEKAMKLLVGRLLGSADGSGGEEGSLYEEFHERAQQFDKYKPIIKSSALADSRRGNRETAQGSGDEAQTAALGRTEAEWGQMSKVAGGMRTGFSDLWGAISRSSVGKQGKQFRAKIGPGPLLESLRLSRYMNIPGGVTAHTRLNSLFYAVEYGTGIAANVGSSHVRLDGPTKDESGDGSWWLGPDVGRGLHIYGQKGFHFLYDEQSRAPRDLYEKAIKAWFPDILRQVIRG